MEGAGTHGDENRGYMRGVSPVAEQEVTYDDVTVDVTVVPKPGPCSRTASRPGPRLRASVVRARLLCPPNAGRPHTVAHNLGWRPSHRHVEPRSCRCDGTTRAYKEVCSGGSSHGHANGLSWLRLFRDCFFFLLLRGLYIALALSHSTRKTFDDGV